MEKTICFGRSMLFLVDILGTDHRTSILPKLTLFAREKLKITTGDRLVPASVDVRLSDELQRFLKDVPVDALGLPRRSLGARCAMVAILRGTSGI